MAMTLSINEREVLEIARTHWTTMIISGFTWFMDCAPLILLRSWECSSFQSLIS